MNDIQIHDKIIPQGYADQIEADLTRREFPWYYVKDVTNPNYGNNSGFTHVAYDYGTQPSEWYPFIKPLVYSIEEATGNKLNELFRIRVGLLPFSDQPTMPSNTPHIDFLWPHYTACYYVNDSDGDTIVYDQTTQEIGLDLDENILNEYVAKTNFTVAQQCSPKKGRLCIFDGLRFHSSSKPKQHDRRLVITINYR